MIVPAPLLTEEQVSDFWLHSGEAARGLWDLPLPEYAALLAQGFQRARADLSTLLPPLAAMTGHPEKHLRVHLEDVLTRLSAPDGWLRAWRQQFPGNEEIWFRVRLQGAARRPGVLVVHGGSIPLASISAVCASLLARTPLLVRVSRHDSLTYPWLFHHLSSVVPAMKGLLLAGTWPHDAQEVWNAALPAGGICVAYGTWENLATLRRRLPATADFVGFGHRFSVAFLSRRLLERPRGPETSRLWTDLAARLAQDALLFGQEGCFSVQGLLLETQDPDLLEAFSLLLHNAGRRFSEEWGPDFRKAAPRAHEYLSLLNISFGGRFVRGLGAQVPCVVLLNSEEIPPPGSCGVVWVLPIRDRTLLAGYLGARHPHLSTLVLGAEEVERPELMEVAIRNGFLRVASPGRAQFPDPWAPHDGVPLLLRILQLIPWEG